MPKFSVIVPVYNRPDELDELLKSLVNQTLKDFETVIVEDGSTLPCDKIVDKYKKALDIKYYYKENEGQGFARNFGYQKAKGEYFIVFDSDCIIPEPYLKNVNEFLEKDWVDAYGGPDTFHPDFTILQKTISHTMTSFLTTGGIRGKRKVVKGFHPRSFNMGISREVFKKTGGYLVPFMGEDMEFSTRIIKEGFKTALIPDAYVYHKRRTSLWKFAMQLKYFGRARINLTRFHKRQFHLIHLLPLVFTIGFISMLVFTIAGHILGTIATALFGIYSLIIFIEGWLKTKSFLASVISPVIVIVQFSFYSYGLIYEWIRKIMGINPNTKYIELY